MDLDELKKPCQELNPRIKELRTIFHAVSYRFTISARG